MTSLGFEHRIKVDRTYSIRQTNQANSNLLVVTIAACSAQFINAIDWVTMCTAKFGGTCTTYQSDVTNKCVLTIMHMGNRELQGSRQAVFQPGRYDVDYANDQYSSFRCISVDRFRGEETKNVSTLDRLPLTRKSWA